MLRLSFKQGLLGVVDGFGVFVDEVADAGLVGVEFEGAVPVLEGTGAEVGSGRVP